MIPAKAKSRWDEKLLSVRSDVKRSWEMSNDTTFMRRTYCGGHLYYYSVFYGFGDIFRFKVIIAAGNETHSVIFLLGPEKRQSDSV